MNVKVIALGNVLMGDDGIAVYIADYLEEKLRGLGIEVIYCETDIGFCITQIKCEDFIILLDAAKFGTDPGVVTCNLLKDYKTDISNFDQHSISLLDLLRLNFPDMDGCVITVEIDRAEFGNGLSPVLKDKFQTMTEMVYEQIKKIYRGCSKICPK